MPEDGRRRPACNPFAGAGVQDRSPTPLPSSRAQPCHPERSEGPCPQFQWPEEFCAVWSTVRSSLSCCSRPVPIRSTRRAGRHLCLNGGGNGTLNRPLVLALIRADSLRARGHLFVLIGRRTFSAAQFLVSDLERWTDAIFVGEPTASRGNHYGDSYRIRLPNSGVTVRVSTLYWQFSDPRDLRPWTPPEVATELTFDDYRHNRDPALEAALAWAPEPALAE
jgi:hypothetical protein